MCEIDCVWLCQSGGSVSLGWSLIRAPRGDVVFVILRGKCWISLLEYFKYEKSALLSNLTMKTNLPDLSVNRVS